MIVNPYILRGYDIRGVVDKDLNPLIAEHFGKAYGTYVIQKHFAVTVVVGHDSRLTSQEYSDHLIKGLISTGVNVIDIGLTMVGNIYWAQYYFKTPSAAMVTASHNPAEYNGFKFANDFSEAMILPELKELLKIVNDEIYIQAPRPGQVQNIDIRNEYFKDLIGRFNIAKKFKIVVDSSNSTPGVIVPDLLRRAGCEVVESNCELDGTFPLGVADPTEMRVAERLRKKVLEEKADLGFSYDADGDRLGIVDEKGAIIWNDVLVALFATDVLNYHPGAKIMYNTLCSKAVDETIRKHGGAPFMWRTGHGFLKKKNQEVKAAFIGELSGHFFFSADFYNHDDGAYSTLRLLDYLSRANQTLSQAVAALPKYISSPEVKLYCADDKKAALMGVISPILKKDFPEAEVIDDERAGDGVRLDLPDGMFVVRYSQNGPYLTIKFEGKTQERYDGLKKYIANLLHSFPEIDWEHKINVNIEAIQS